MFVIWPQICPKTRPANVVLFLLLATAVYLAQARCILAETACVHCSGPEATYSCQVSGRESGKDHAAGLYCASRLAGERGHESCAAMREADACAGIPVTYEQEETLPLQSSYESETVKLEPKPRKGEPETLGEFAEDTVEGSQNAAKKAGETIGDAASKAGKATVDAIQGAGEAIGSATKKTLKCLGSALNDC